MKTFMSIVATIFGFIGIILVCIMLGFGGTYFQLEMYKFFGIRFENARRDIFEQSKSYNQGMIQELQSFMIQYSQAKTPDEKSVIASVVLQRTADFNVDDVRVPSEIRLFVHNLRTGNLN